MKAVKSILIACALVGGLILVSGCAKESVDMDKVVTLSFDKSSWEVGAEGLRFRVCLTTDGISRLSVRGVELDGVYTENVFVLETGEGYYDVNSYANPFVYEGLTVIGEGASVVIDLGVNTGDERRFVIDLSGGALSHGTIYVTQAAGAL